MSMPMPICGHLLILFEFNRLIPHFSLLAASQPTMVDDFLARRARGRPSFCRPVCRFAAPAKRPDAASPSRRANMPTRPTHAGARVTEEGGLATGGRREATNWPAWRSPLPPPSAKDRPTSSRRKPQQKVLARLLAQPIPMAPAWELASRRTRNASLTDSGG